MGVGSAFNTALGGLSAYGNQVGYISDNLANVSTPGFKRVDANFQSYVTLATPTIENPGGVNITPTYRNNLAGQVSSSDNPTAFSISGGSGFAPVAVPTSVTGGVAVFGNSLPHYTRACDFNVDTNGYLVNSAGQYLEGVKEQNTYKSDVPGTPSLGNLVGVRVDPTIYKSIPGAASTSINYNANFPAGMTATALPVTYAAGVTQPSACTPAAQVTSQLQFFDSLGNSRTLQLTYQKVPVDTVNGPMTATGALDDSAGQWKLIGAIVPGVPTGVGSYLDVLAGLTALAAGNDSTGIALPVAPPASATTIATNTAAIANASAFLAAVNPATAPLDSLYFTSAGALNGNTTTGVLPVINLPIDWSLATSSTGATTPQNISVNYGAISTATAPATGTTQYAGSNLEVRSVSDSTGQAPGSFQKASIDDSGFVVFSYSNGNQLKPYRIPLVTFSDSDKLDRITGAVFAGNDTLAGKPVARWSGEGDSGKIIASTIEASNVDIADELTKMIVAQRAYSSNGKVITTADEMIQEALGLKH
ncbi:MAG: flagellar hook-basal body complex protein [Rhodospirillaceae bacterium]